MEKLKGPVPLSAFYVLTLGTLLLLVIWGSRAVSVISENMPISRSCCYVIDPGHGGIDGGATSCTGILESKFNLDISLKLNDLLHFLGYETMLIRNGDYSVYTEGSTIAARFAAKGLIDGHTKRYFTHFAHNCGMIRDELAAVAKEKYGFEVTYDGCEVEV